MEKKKTETKSVITVEMILKMIWISSSKKKDKKKNIKKYHLSIKGDAGESQGILCHFKFLSVQVFVKRPFAG